MNKTIKTIITTIILIIILCTPNISFATEASEPETAQITLESARAQIANWAIAFVDSEGTKCKYSLDFEARGVTYNGGYKQEQYVFDCVGCVSYIIHYSIGITFEGAESGQSGFVTPQNNVRDTTHFELHNISDNPQPGDVLISTQGQGGSNQNHVAIYCGNGEIVDILRNKSAEVRKVDSNWRGIGNQSCKFTKFARLKSIQGASFTPIEGGTILPSPGENTGNSGNPDTDVVDLDEVAEQFKYQGMPTDISYSQEKREGFRWIFDGIEGAADYIIGLIFTIVKAPIVGLTSATEQAINSMLHSANV